MAEIVPQRPLGRSGVTVSALGAGTSAWRHGESRFGAYQALRDGGVDFVDTAEVYFWGESERAVAACRKRDGRPVKIATKFAPFFRRTGARRMIGALDASLARLEVEAVDLYLVHFPFPFASLDGFAEGLIEAARSGKARAVGVSNFGAGAMRRMADRLGRAGVALAANEVNYSLLHRSPERNGVLAACRELDAALLAYFPLGRARLTGALAEAARDPRVAALQRLLDEVGQTHHAPAAQAALNWLLARDPHIIPIPGTSSARHAQSNAEAVRWSLTEAEFAAIDAASAAAA